MAMNCAKHWSKLEINLYTAGIELSKLSIFCRLITKLPIFDLNSKKLSDIEVVEKSLNQLKEYVFSL